MEYNASKKVVYLLIYMYIKDTYAFTEDTI